jgi:sugar phosphate isomerase/epimerase
MRLSYSNLACPEWPFERTVEAVATYGFDGIEIRLFDGDVVTPLLSQSSRRRAESALRSSGVSVAALDTSLQLVTTDRHGFLYDLDAMAEIAAQWGAPLLRIFGGALPESPDMRRDAIKQAAELLAEAAPLAGYYGARLALETHDDFSSAHVVAEVLNSVGGSAGAVYDAFHPHRLGESPPEVLETLGRHISLVQVKDARRDPSRQDQWQLVPVGEGEVPVPDLLSLLSSAGYVGWVSLEFEKKWHPELASPEQALRPQAQTLRRWMQALP